MNRLFLVGTFGASGLFLVDTAAKGSALLLLAAVTATVLRRDSAATRHLVWLLAIVAMLVVPALSAVLPQWRVLPEWAAIPAQSTANDDALRAMSAPSGSASTAQRPAQIAASDVPPIVPEPSVAELPTRSSQAPATQSKPVPHPVAAVTQWPLTIPLFWSAGFCLLVIRLVCARWLLQRTEAQATVIGPVDETGAPNLDPLRIAFEIARSRIGFNRAVALLTHPDKTIPLVWGVFRHRLLLPASARDWSDDQLRSVLLHELAHIRRRDTLTQLLTQIACALYWFNPLVWVAAWRLGVERERAADDLVLASGVRPSDYAGHLLDIVSSLSPARWAQPCGVAMARTSSLEGRLLAVLSKNLNRRGTSMTLTALALVLAAGIAIPIAMLCAADKPWYAPSASHYGSNQISTYCIHDGKDADFVIVYHGSFDSSSDNTANAKTRTWKNSARLTLLVNRETKEIALSRDHRAPDRLKLAGKDYDLKQGRVFLLTEGGKIIRQLALNPPAIREKADAEALAKQIADIPPQERLTTSRQPQHEYAQALFQRFQSLSRSDGKIPGALVGRLAKQVETFLKQYPNDEKARDLAKIQPRLDATHDWAPADVVAILDEITALTTAPISWTNLPLEFEGMKHLRGGQPLPDELAKIAWGDPAENGLRVAWLLEPAELEYALGTVLKARVLFHNAGKAPVISSTDAWHQFDEHVAKDANGKEIKVTGSWYSGITPRASFRLAPGEYCEVLGHGIAIGAGEYREEFSTGSVGAIIEAKAGDDVRLTHTVDASQGGFTRPDDPKDPDELWKKHIADRIALEGPIPASFADRKLLIQRVTMDLFGESPTVDEVIRFTKAEAATGLDNLVTRLQEKPRIKEWAGRLPTGETKFRVTAADPDAAARPRTASAPGRYVLADDVHLLVSQITTEARRTNKAVIAFLSPDPKVESPHKPFEIALPDGLNNWGAVWERGSGELWILQKGLVRKYDFTDPDDVKEVRFDPGSITDIPEPLRAPMKKVFDAPDAPVQQQNNREPKNSAKLPAGLEEKLQWGEPVNGLRMALVRTRIFDEKAPEEIFDLQLVVQNVSESPVRLVDSSNAPKSRHLTMKLKGAPLAGFHGANPAGGEHAIGPREVAVLRLFGQMEKEHSITAEDPAMTFIAELQVDEAPAGAWSGTLVSADTFGMFSAFGLAPRHKASQSLFASWNAIARRDGSIPGALIGNLAENVRTFIKNNPTWKTTPKLTEMLPELDASRDWRGPEAIDLLDRLAGVQDSPVTMAASHEWENTIQTGLPLPDHLKDAPWGPPDATGLRLAWGLEPDQKEYRLGTPIKARPLVYNAGKKPVVFRAPTFHEARHTAHDTKGNELPVEAANWLTLSRLLPYRLAPGEFIELNVAGLGVGTSKSIEIWQDMRVGSWINAKAGDEVTVTTSPVPLGDYQRETPREGAPGWWYDFVSARLARHRPLPAGAEERRRLLYRVAMELFGTPVNQETNNNFVNDKSPNALESLAKVLSHRARMPSFSGTLTAAPRTFKVLPADPDAANRPRVAHNPGRYTLTPGAVLEVSRRPVDERVKNEASLHFYAVDPKAEAPGKPVTLTLPDGYETWAVGWARGTPILWLMSAGKVQRYDFTDPARVQESTLEGQEIVETVPREILEALRAILSRAGDAGKKHGKGPPASTR